MAERAIWSGAISFGLVHVPVKLFSAVSPGKVIDLVEALEASLAKGTRAVRGRRKPARRKSAA